MVKDSQRAVCERFGVAPMEAPDDLKLGIALVDSEGPIHGLRHPLEGDTSGWYVWRGEFSEADAFFSPLHIRHLATRLPEIVPYLALPPGWRLLLAPGCEDVWYDESLLDVGTSGD